MDRQEVAILLVVLATAAALAMAWSLQGTLAVIVLIVIFLCSPASK